MAKKVRPGLEEDPQRDLVYAVEKIHLAGHCRHTMARKHIRKWTRSVCRAYGVPMPKLSFGKVDRGFSAHYDHENATVRLDPKWGCNGLTLLHELAHLICYTHYPRAQDHGAAFCRVYGELLDRNRLVPFAGWKALCARHGVKVLRYLPKH